MGDDPTEDYHLILQFPADYQELPCVSDDWTSLVRAHSNSG